LAQGVCVVCVIFLIIRDAHKNRVLRARTHEKMYIYHPVMWLM